MLRRGGCIKGKKGFEWNGEGGVEGKEYEPGRVDGST